MVVFRIPEEFELLAFFGKDPIERTADGYMCYQVINPHGVTLRFSFDVSQRSVQTVFSIGAKTIATVSHEGATKMAVDDLLSCEFVSNGARTLLKVEPAPGFVVTWSSLSS